MRLGWAWQGMTSQGRHGKVWHGLSWHATCTVYPESAHTPHRCRQVYRWGSTKEEETNTHVGKSSTGRRSPAGIKRPLVGVVCWHLIETRCQRSAFGKAIGETLRKTIDCAGTARACTTLLNPVWKQQGPSLNEVAMGRSVVVRFLPNWCLLDHMQLKPGGLVRPGSIDSIICGLMCYSSGDRRQQDGWMGPVPLTVRAAQMGIRCH